MSDRPFTVQQFGPFRYDLKQRLLFRQGQLVPLPPKAIDTLHVLLERRGQVIEKAELMKLVWPDCVVEEIGLARNISLLRKALGDDGEAYIETIPKRGYKFAAEVGHASAAPRQRYRLRWICAALAAGLLALAAVVYWQFYRPSRYVPPAGAAASLAVLPFECLSPDLQRDGFAQGFADRLVEEMARLKSVHMISPSTVQRYMGLRVPAAVMARLLGLDVIVEGTAQKLGDRVRVSVRLTDVHSGTLIWVEGYEIGAGDPEAQAEVAHAAALQIRQRLSR